MHSRPFKPINPAYNRTFKVGQLSLGLVVPIENYANGPVPAMSEHVERAVLAERLGFKAAWLRDVPFNVPSFEDAGQVFDPFVYLGMLAAHTGRIGLGVASVILPLRHPAHVAKAAATADVLSEGRLLLGIASGDRPEEYPALGINYAQRGARFRASYEDIRAAAEVNAGMDMLPKPMAGRLPLLITGLSQQTPEWVAGHGDGWMTYPRPAPAQAQLIADYRRGIDKSGADNKPVMEPLYIDLLDDADAPPQPIHLGLRLGANALRDYLNSRQAIGVNHVALNLRFNAQGTQRTLQRLADDILPHFHQQESNDD